MVFADEKALLPLNIYSCGSFAFGYKSPGTGAAGKEKITRNMHYSVIKGAVTLGNFSCNLSRNFVATQVERTVA